MRRVMTVPEGSRVRATEAMADSLGDLVRMVWEKMRLAGEAGSLLEDRGGASGGDPQGPRRSGRRNCPSSA